MPSQPRTDTVHGPPAPRAARSAARRAALLAARTPRRPGRRGRPARPRRLPPPPSLSPSSVSVEQEDQVYDIEDQVYAVAQEDGRLPPDTPGAGFGAVPPLMLAGIDEDDTWEPNVVRGID